MTILRHPPSRRPDPHSFGAPPGSVRVENFDTRLTPETVAALTAVDENLRMASVRDRSVPVA